MYRIRQCADISIRRGCGFGLLAIVCAMTGMAHEATLALRGGAIMVMVMWLILVAKGVHAPVRRYRDTEVWIMLDKRLDGVPAERLQQAIGGVLRERYLWHAYVFAGVAALMWLMTFILRAIS
jgi:hypothetical protein